MVYKTKVSWDATYDVIVIGFGGAGAGAARFAADNNAKVLLIDAALKEAKAVILDMLVARLLGDQILIN